MKKSILILFVFALVAGSIRADQQIKKENDVNASKDNEEKKESK